MNEIIYQKGKTSVCTSTTLFLLKFPNSTYCPQFNCSLIEGCANFTTLKKEVKVHQPIKGIKGKSVKSKIEHEDSRIDFELFWDDNEKNQNSGDKMKNEDDTKYTKDHKRNRVVAEEDNALSKNNTVAAEIGGIYSDSTTDLEFKSNLNVIRTMLLEVKSVTLAMQTEKGEVRMFSDIMYGIK